MSTAEAWERVLEPKHEAAAGARPAVDRVKKWGWTVRDAPGRFEWVPKVDLRIDTRYQRENISRAKIRALAADWSWLACGSLIAVERGDGSLWLVDGQHRAMAAMERSDITALPCLIFASEGIVQEATGFLAANTNRKPITALERFDARIVAGDRIAVKIGELVERHGYQFAQNCYATNRKLKAVTAMYHMATIDFNVTESVFALAVDSAGGQMLYERVLLGLFFIERKLRAKGETLDERRLRARIVKLGMKALNEATNRACGYHGKGGEKVYAGGILDLVNRGCRNPISLAPAASDDDRP